MTDSLSLVSAMANKNAELAGRNSICLICNMDAVSRRQVEELMSRGTSNNTIIAFARNLPNPVDLNATIIAKHVDHLPARNFIFKEILERRMKEAGLSLDDNTQQRLTPVAYIEMLMHDAAQNLVENPGSTNPYLGMQAAKTLMQIDKEKAENEDVMQWVLKFKQLVDAIKKVCSDEQIDRILEAISDAQ